MNTMTKKVIAIISVLKPVDDTRNFEKIARTISNTNKYEINIIGFSIKKEISHPNITFHPVFRFGRTNIKRLSVSFKILKIILKVKPELLIVTSPEILIVSVLYKILFGAKIIYDVQENYYRNIVYTRTYPFLLKFPIATLIRFLEMTSSPFVDRFFLAEKIYKDQLKFTTHNSLIIENKAIIPRTENAENKSIKKEITFLYSGTIAEHYGIFNAIHFIDKLKSANYLVKLVIAGYSAQKTTFQKLKAAINNKEYIQFVGGQELVPHDQIIEAMQQADFCILPYQPSKSTDGRIPTKLFECLAMEKPVIISPNLAWNVIIMRNNAGIIYDFKKPELLPLEKLQEKFYGNNLSSTYRWESISNILTEEIQKILS